MNTVQEQMVRNTEGRGGKWPPTFPKITSQLLISDHQCP